MAPPAVSGGVPGRRYPRPLALRARRRLASPTREGSRAVRAARFHHSGSLLAPLPTAALAPSSSSGTVGEIVAAGRWGVNSGRRVTTPEIGQGMTARAVRTRDATAPTAMRPVSLGHQARAAMTASAAAGPPRVRPSATRRDHVASPPATA